MKLQNRDWAIIALFVLLGVTNYMFYTTTKNQNLSHRSHVDAWIIQQDQISQLHNCINENTTPCELKVIDM